MKRSNYIAYFTIAVIWVVVFVLMITVLSDPRFGL